MCVGNLLWVFFYYFLEIHVCFDCLCLKNKRKLSLSHKLFEDNFFDELSGIGIIKTLVNIVSCYGFVQENTSTLIYTEIIKFLSYYLYEGFVKIPHDYQTLYNVLLKVKQCMHAVDIFDGGSVTTFKSAINFIDNTIKKIQHIKTILNEFTSTYYDDTDGCFEFFPKNIQLFL